MDEKIVIFGASGGARKVSQTLENMGYVIAFFVDNDKNKWGKTFENKLIYTPEFLLDLSYKCNIIIASEYQKEIEEQLSKMRLLENVILKEQLIIEYLDKNMKQFDYLKNKKIMFCGTRSIIIDLLEGVTLGGIENWSFMVAEELAKAGRKVSIYSKKTSEKPPVALESFIEYFNAEYYLYWQSIQELVKALLLRLPCSVIINKHTQLQFAAYIVKQYYPEQIKIISAVHNDLCGLYRRQKYLEPQSDVIHCVSKKIEVKLEKEYGISSCKLYYKESPVDYEQNFEKKYACASEYIRIGYAGRLQRSQKRTDLLIPFIEKLNAKQVNYNLSIAGDGELYEYLKKYVTEEKCNDKITVLGKLSREEMVEFWKQKDVFVNLSEFEGVGLSMLEAMSYGAIPIETRVAGAEEFIENGVNGFVCDIGDMDAIVESVFVLDNNREKMELFGRRTREIIRQKCNKEDYVQYLLGLIDEV